MATKKAAKILAPEVETPAAADEGKKTSYANFKMDADDYMEVRLASVRSRQSLQAFMLAAITYYMKEKHGITLPSATASESKTKKK